MQELNNKKLISLLKKVYKKPQIELTNWQNPTQFMVCVILSAQATDKGVNKISESLFNRYKTTQDFATADIDELKKYIKSINFYNNKALKIIQACQYLQQNHNGQMPSDIDTLIKIPGIGRKSANVILNVIFKVSQGIVVDTHITRLAQRLGLTSNIDAFKIEQDLMTQIDKKDWGYFSASAVLHGRYVCKARKPLCKECVLIDICPYQTKNL